MAIDRESASDKAQKRKISDITEELIASNKARKDSTDKLTDTMEKITSGIVATPAKVGRGPDRQPHQRREATPENESPQETGDNEDVVSAIRNQSDVIRDAQLSEEDQREQMSIFTSISRGIQGIWNTAQEQGEDASLKSGKMSIALQLLAPMISGAITGLLAGMVQFQLKMIKNLGKILLPIKPLINSLNKLGQKFPILAKAFGGIANFAATIGRHLNVNKFVNAVKFMGTVIGAVVTGLGIAGQVFLGWVGKITGLTSWAKNMGTAFTTMASGIRAIMAPIHVASEGISHLNTMIKTGADVIVRFKAIFGKVFEFMKRWGGPLKIIFAAVEGIKGAMEGWKTDGFVGLIKGAVKGVFQSIVGSLFDLLFGVTAWVLDAFGFEGIADTLRSISVTDIFMGFFNNIVDYMAGWVGDVMNLFTDFSWSGLTNVIMGLVKLPMVWFSELINMAAGIFGVKVFGEGSLWDTVVTPFIDDTIGKIKSMFGFGVDGGGFSLMTWIYEHSIKRPIAFLKDLFTFSAADMTMSGGLMKLVDILYAPLNLAVNWLRGLFEFGDPDKPFKFSTFIVESLQRPIAFLKDLFSFSPEDMTMSGMLMKFTDILYAPVNLAVNWLQGIFGFGDPDEPFKLSTFISEVMDKAIAWVKDKLDIFGLFGKDDQDNTIMKVPTANEINDGVKSVAEDIKGAWSSVKGWFGGDESLTKKSSGQSEVYAKSNSAANNQPTIVVNNVNNSSNSSSVSNSSAVIGQSGGSRDHYDAVSSMMGSY